MCLGGGGSVVVSACLNIVKPKRGLEKFRWEDREFRIVSKNAKLVEISFLFLCVFFALALIGVGARS